MSSRRRFRQLDGILLLDKPSGISSNAALQRAKSLFGAEKAGHTGSLDPLASGVLPVCFGEATKIAGLLLDSDKAYEASLRLGITTDTDDSDGETLRERVVPILDDVQIRRVLALFVGRIDQRAPIYSALKQGGEPLYRRVRRGEIIEAPIRPVHIHSIDLLGMTPERLDLRIVCGSGTYIRSLARDIGEYLQCGAHIVALRRLWVAPFRQSRMHVLADLEMHAGCDDSQGLDDCLLPLEAGLRHFPTIRLNGTEGERFKHGQRLRGNWDACPCAVAVDEADRALGLARVDATGLLHTRRRFNR